MKKKLQNQECNLTKEYEALAIAFRREKLAREKAEIVLDNRASFLDKINQQLREQYVQSSRRNLEFEYLYRITRLDTVTNNIDEMFLKFLEISSRLIWSEISFCFKYSRSQNNLEPLYLNILGEDSTQKNSERIFRSENFNFLLESVDIDAPKKLDNFIEKMLAINSKYKMNHGYLFPITIDEDDCYLFLFSYPKNYELPKESIDLVTSGTLQVKSFIQKDKASKLLLENYEKLKQVKTQLIQSEKMASLGTISAGIAHEINNPLSFLMTNLEVLKEYISSISQYIDLLEKEHPLNINGKREQFNLDYILEDTPSLMSESLEGVERIKEIVSGLKTFSRADEGTFKEVEINNCLETALKLVSNELKHKCRVLTSFDKIPLVYGSQGQLIQVFTNLFVNSAHAIEEKGVIDIKTYNQNGKVVIQIKDSGKGISQENLSNLFTPFFTTKPTGQGTGLGLSISYGIIQKHQGEILCASELGVGTTFTISLPTLKVAA